MYMRLVQAKMNPDSLPQVREVYEKKIIPTLQKVDGCLHISLLQSVSHPDECISLTLWRQRHYAEKYEASGLFSNLLQDVEPYSAGSSEYELHLGPDLTLHYDPVTEPPLVQAFDVPIHSASAILPRDPRKSIFLRIVTPQIREGMMEEFKRTYATKVLPQLRAVPGCVQAHLVENLQQPNQVISFTIWHNRQDAENYEKSGLFTELTGKVEHCFAEMYQWKQQLGKEGVGHVVTSEDLSVEGYNVVIGRNFM